MKAIAVVGRARQPETLLADLLHWHGLSVFQIDDDQALLPLLSFIAPELIIIESFDAKEAQELCDRIKRSPVVGQVPVIVCSSQCAHVISNTSNPDNNADAYLYAPYTAEDVFAHVQALRPLTNTFSDGITTSAWIDS